MKFSNILKFLLGVFIVNAFEICPSIEINGYKYLLGSLSNQNIVAIYKNTIIQISPCKLFTCEYLLDSQKISSSTFVGKRSQSSCEPYTSENAPLKDYYSLLNQSKPQNGLAIEFPPIFLDGFLYGSKIDIFCPKIVLDKDLNADLKTTCQQVEQQQNDIVKKVMHCQVYSTVGCPELATNNFWQFLYKSSIIFAIVFWLIAIFMLFIGYLAIRGTIWIFGVFTGTVFAIVLAAENYINFITETDGIYIYVICLSFFLGMVTGIVFLTIPKLGYANIGVWVALIFSLLLQNSVFYLTGSNLALYITFGVLSLIMIVVSLLELKWFIILCSSFVGGFWAIRPLGFFLPYYPNELSASRNFSIDIETPWQFYLYLISILVLTVLGTAFQICLYKKTHGRYHGKNQAYYLQRQGDIKKKLRKIFEFKEVRKLLKNGKNQVVQLRNMIFDKSEVSSSLSKQNDGYVEMSFIQKKNSKNKKEYKMQEIQSDEQSSESQFKKKI